MKVTIRHNGKQVPAHERRKSGYVTQALIDQHGSFRDAVRALNEGAAG